MKLKANQVASVLADPSRYPALLFYGPDAGLVSERAAAARQGYARVGAVGDGDAAVEIQELAEETLKADPASLGAAAFAQSLFGEQTVLRLRLRGEAAKKALETLAQEARAQSAPHYPVVVEAGDLKPSSGLRKLFEQSKTWGVIACYPDTARAKSDVVEAMLRQAGLSIDPKALALLLSMLGDDRAQTRQEINKLILYKDARREGDGPAVTAQDITAILATSPTVSADTLLEKIIAGNLKDLDRTLIGLDEQGLVPAQVLRGLISRLRDVELLKAETAQGASLEQAFGRIRLSKFHPRAKLFSAAVGWFSAGRLSRALSLTLTTELAMRQTGSRESVLLNRCALALSRLPKG
ncbi:MAG: DNA polymerase III subunit delta [Pseudomonadota bacterium]